MDCAVACLAMICGVSYEQALMAFRHNVYSAGATIAQIRQAARAIGPGFNLSWSRKVDDLSEATGILCVSSAKWPNDHLVIIKEDQIIDTDATLWDADVFMAAYEARPISILRIKED